MHWRPAYRARRATIDKALVLATWWVITRSMVVYAVVLGLLLMFFASDHTTINTPSFDLILHWAPLPAWGLVIIISAITWWLSRGLLCIFAGLAMAVWYFAFACAFFAAWVSLDVPNTTVTAWATYGFLGWAWMCVTYVVWKDEEHVREEMAQVQALEAAASELEARQAEEP